MTDDTLFDTDRICRRCGRLAEIPADLDTCGYCRHLDHRNAASGCDWCATRTPAESPTDVGHRAATASEDSANPEWRHAVKTTLARFVRERRPFTSAHVLWVVRELGIETKDARALGAVMKSAQRAGLITPTGRFIPSPLPEHHGAPKREWVAA